MIDIIYDCKDFTVCLKAAGLISEMVESSPISLPKILKEQLGLSEIFVVHRLDKEVEGLIVFAKNSKAAASLSAQISDGAFAKKYIATVSGKFENNQGELCDLLYHDKQRNKTFVVKRKRNGVKDAKLKYNVLHYDSKLDRTTVEIDLLTGRTHQIRVQLASRLHPVCGDKKYGSKDSDKPILLFSSMLQFNHTETNEQITFKSEPFFYKNSNY